MSNKTKWRIMNIIIMIVITLALILIWSGPDEEDEKGQTLGLSPTTETSLIPPLNITPTDPAREWVLREEWHWAVAERTTTTVRASRSKTRTVLPNHVTTPSPPRVRGDVWTALARCESGGDPNSRSANGLYTGAFQFLDSTWQSLGYSGSAADHPYTVQLEAAQKLQARSGWGQWPRCARKLGLR